MTKIEIDGHKIELDETPEGMIVTDVMIIRRAIEVSETGHISDTVLIDRTPQTSWILQTGMLAAATEETSFTTVIGDEDD